MEHNKIGNYQLPITDYRLPFGYLRDAMAFGSHYTVPAAGDSM